MDSSGVNAHVIAHHAAPERLCLGALYPAVQRVLEIAALFDVVRSTADQTARFDTSSLNTRCSLRPAGVRCP